MNANGNGVAAPGLWPVMLTPFTRDRHIDWPGADRLTDWYIESGSAGLFTVCLSSEMYALTEEERLSLARRVARRAAGRVPVVAAGTFGGPMPAQAETMRRMAETGVDAVVCLVNQLASAEEPDDAWTRNTEALLELTDDMPLGLYECPAPYHRILSPGLLAWAASTGRFHFLKETSCRLAVIREKVAVVRGKPLGFYNAHTITLLESLRLGADGYSGIGANLYPALFAWLCRHYHEQPEMADRLQRFLSITQAVVDRRYPASAKHYLARAGLGIETACRIRGDGLTENDTGMLLALRDAAREWHQTLGLPEASL